MTFRPTAIRALTLTALFTLGLVAGASADEGRFKDGFARKSGAMDAVQRGDRTQRGRWDAQNRQLDSRTRRTVEGRSSRAPQLREAGNRVRTDRNMRRMGEDLKRRAPKTQKATRAARTGRVKTSARNVRFRLPDGTKARPGAHKKGPKSVARSKAKSSKKVTKAKGASSKKVAKTKTRSSKKVAKAKTKAPKAKGSKISKSAIGKGLAVGAAAAVIGVSVPGPIEAATWVGDTIRDPKNAGKRIGRLGKNTVKEVGKGLKTITNPKQMAKNTGKLAHGVGKAAITTVTRPDKAVKAVGKEVVNLGKSIGGIFAKKK